MGVGGGGRGKHCNYPFAITGDCHPYGTGAAKKRLGASQSPVPGCDLPLVRGMFSLAMTFEQGVGKGRRGKERGEVRKGGGKGGK